MLSEDVLPSADRDFHMSSRFQLATSTLVLALGLGTSNSGLCASPAITTEAARRIDSLFSTWDNAHSPGCALGVSRHGNVVYTRGYGMSNLEYDVAIAPDSIFQVGSIAKQFTAFAIGLLAADGKLSLDDDIRRYLPELPDYGHTVTLRHLLAHTGGFRDYWTLLRRGGWRPEDMVTEDDALKILARQKSLNFQPGTEFLYSNTGYTLLAVVVKRVSGQSLRDFAAVRIFTPLAMLDTHIQDDHTEIVRRRTSAYEPRTGGGLKISIPITDTSGATNLFTTVGDLLKWEQNLVDGRVGGRALVEQMQLPGRLDDGTATGYGYGLLVEPYRGVRTVNHSGSEAGYRADALRFPDQDLNIALLCNSSAVNPRVLTRKVADIVLEASVLQPAPSMVATTPAERERLVGTYWNPKTQDVWRILVKDGKLMTDSGSDPLVSLGGGRYRLGEQTTELTFSGANTSASLEVRMAPATPQVFMRVPLPVYSGADLRAYAGEYCSDEVQANYKIDVTPERYLRVSRSKYDPSILDAVTVDVFANRRLGTISFLRTSSGNVRGFVLTTGSTRGLSFIRVTAEVHGDCSRPGT
jgi:CubicO group peptidase (beta-lactamase class C family)